MCWYSSQRSHCRLQLTPCYVCMPRRPPIQAARLFTEVYSRFVIFPGFPPIITPLPLPSPQSPSLLGHALVPRHQEARGKRCPASHQNFKSPHHQVISLQPFPNPSYPNSITTAATAFLFTRTADRYPSRQGRARWRRCRPGGSGSRAPTRSPRSSPAAAPAASSPSSSCRPRGPGTRRRLVRIPSVVSFVSARPSLAGVKGVTL